MLLLNALCQDTKSLPKNTRIALYVEYFWFSVRAQSQRRRASLWRNESLFCRLLEWPHRGAHLPVIGLAPAEPGVGDKITAAHRVHDVGIVDPGRYGAVLRQGARRLQQPPPGGHDHLIARRQMLGQVIGDRP